MTILYLLIPVTIVLSAVGGDPIRNVGPPDDRLFRLRSG
ncbi:hypothetical protein SAMN05421853_11570 [Roseivivax halotolerans]|uniref:Uncharacterized protein n=1 Tax=Roseivivax halotolerans TaxID=93684 RepID=A0A1I6A733_9RHOB|nr:hypothetical protein SAMN05421853_11570 [Roseivivax halotolerans]